MKQIFKDCWRLYRLWCSEGDWAYYDMLVGFIASFPATIGEPIANYFGVVY